MEEEETLEEGAMLEELPMNPAPSPCSKVKVNVNVHIRFVDDILCLGRFLRGQGPATQRPAPVRIFSPGLIGHPRI
jgi:hypothetical protein